MSDPVSKITENNYTISQPLEETEQQEDYIFHFPIKLKECSLNPDTVLLEFYKEQIQDLLKIVFFSKDGEKVMLTEFGFLNEPEIKYPLWHD
ncbi:MAG: hypothetical protein RBT80_19065 [Candidatus Vecturithrix sp.]|jgi:hypothetical protein|nr:hypothetical protein [Candidatus Vecturithrix sp.]